MESIKNTPNYIHKEGDNDALKKELNIALEKELDMIIRGLALCEIE